MNTEVILRVALLVVITHLIVLLGCSKKKDESHAKSNSYSKLDSQASVESATQSDVEGLAAKGMLESRAADFKKKTMRVRVQNNEGTPIKGANIHRSVWAKVRFDANADYITNDNGEANMELPESMDILRLWATKSGYVPLFVNFDSREMNGVAFPNEFTFTIDKGTTIGGFVVDDSGAPIVKARVEVSIDSRESDGRGEVVVSRWLAEGKDGCMTDKRGYWSLSNVPPGNNHKIGLRLTHPGYVDDLDWRGFNDTSHFTIEQLRNRVARVVMERN